MEKDFDVVIYGATGFTGQLVVKYFSSINTEVNWAIAGRNKTKLEEVAGKFAEGVEILIADSDDEQALDSITSRTIGFFSSHKVSPVVVPFKPTKATISPA